MREKKIERREGVHRYRETEGKRERGGLHPFIVRRTGDTNKSSLLLLLCPPRFFHVTYVFAIETSKVDARYSWPRYIFESGYFPLNFCLLLRPKIIALCQRQYSLLALSCVSDGMFTLFADLVPSQMLESDSSDFDVGIPTIMFQMCQ